MVSPTWSLRRTTAGRVVGVDFARCLALLGMICTHLVDPRDADGQVTALQQLAGGRASALFAVLAGVSLALVTGGTKPASGIPLVRARAALVVRAVLIATLGLWLGGLRSGIAVILTYYGVLFLLGLPFLGLRARPLAALAAVIAVTVPLLSYLVRPHLPATDAGQPTADDLTRLPALLTDLLLTGTYPAVPWLAYLLLGMALGRLPLARPAVAARVAGVGAVVAFVGWYVGHLTTSATSVQAALVATQGRSPALPWPLLEQQLIDGLHGTTPTESWWWLLVAAPHSTTTFDLLHTAGSAMVVLALCVLVAQRQPRQWAVLGGAGAMTLSLYTLHVVLASTVLPRTVPYAPAQHLVLVLVIGAVFATARLKGPLEWVITSAGRGLATSRPQPTSRR